MFFNRKALFFALFLSLIFPFSGYAGSKKMLSDKNQALVNNHFNAYKMCAGSDLLAKLKRKISQDNVRNITSQKMVQYGVKQLKKNRRCYSHIDQIVAIYNPKTSKQKKAIEHGVMTSFTGIILGLMKKSH